MPRRCSRLPIEMKEEEHIAAYFESPGERRRWPASGRRMYYIRDPRVLPLVSGGAEVIGNGVLAKAANANVVFCQLVPWQFDPNEADEPQADVPALLASGHPAGGEHRGGWEHAAPRSVSQSR